MADDAAAPVDPKTRFAGFVRAVARGATLGRALALDEAQEAMALILAGAAEPVQVGAFLAVLRYRQETPEELAGFARAVRAAFGAETRTPFADLDWPSYADRHKQLPYFTLAALLLAESGTRVLMHGVAGVGSATTPKTLTALGIAPARDLDEAAAHIARTRFAYAPVERFCPTLAQLFALRPLLGVRTAVNSFAREINPGNAPHQLQGVFHPAYVPTHLAAARLLAQPHLALFKGGAGEVQRNPEKALSVTTLHDGTAGEEDWPSVSGAERHPWRDEPLEPTRVASLWRGEWEAPGPVAAVQGTAALALKLVGRAATVEAAEEMARDLWVRRDKAKFGAR
ncbi:MAG TPA: glycosyl transferase family protein [Alphaproteobacteria bacterium]|nr:glycosyl transferase family protein [Alphaproteobacteria bacterium]